MNDSIVPFVKEAKIAWFSYLNIGGALALSASSNKRLFLELMANNKIDSRLESKGCNSAPFEYKYSATSDFLSPIALDK